MVVKLIAHRANINGPSDSENNPKQIDSCIELGYDVEIDIRYDTLSQLFWLGHDKPQYQVSCEWIYNRNSYLWIHCKDITTLKKFIEYENSGYEYFWHQQDDFTLTSNNYIWTFPGKPYTNRSIIVMPESNTEISNLNTLRDVNCYGICTDYPSKLK